MQHVWKTEHERNRHLNRSVDDLSHQRTALAEEIGDAKWELSSSYIRLAGNLVKEGQIGAAQKLLESCPIEHRNWEWHYYKKQCNPVAIELTRQQLAAMADGKVTIKVAGKQVDFIPATSAKIDEDKALMQTAAAALLDEQLAILPAGTIQSTAVAHNGKGQRIALTFEYRPQRPAGAKRTHGVIVFDKATGVLERTLPWYGDRIHHLAFGSDDRWLVAADNQKGIVWDTATDYQAFDLGVNDKEVFHARFTPDGRQLVTAGSTAGGKSICVWDVVTGEQSYSLDITDTGGAYSISLNDDASTLAAGCENKTVVWKLNNQDRILEIDNGCQSVALHPSGRWLVCGSLVWEVDAGVEIARLSDKGGQGVAFRPDGSQIAIRRTKKRAILGFSFLERNACSRNSRHGKSAYI